MCQYYATHHNNQYYGTHEAPNKFLLQGQPAAKIFKHQHQLTKLGSLSLKKLEVARYTECVVIMSTANLQLQFFF